MRTASRNAVLFGVVPLATALIATACSRGLRDGATASAEVPKPGDAPAVGDAAAPLSAPATQASAAEPKGPPPRPGMAWVPPGVLLAGTAPDKTPRIAEEELPGTPIQLNGFYIDLLAYPNEPGAIATTNVSREDAAHLCEAKGKRLCTEYEWERACKGPDNTSYEYGDAYRAAACGTGVSALVSARRPSGERVQCKSGFGLLDMHGGPWEWTDSAWRRGAHASPTPLYVLRGGNAEAGELAGRCANALARRPVVKSPWMGFRCCAGPKNDPDMEFELKRGAVLERSAKPSELAAPLVALGTKIWGSDGAGAFVATHAWTWRPVPNEELRVTSGCAHPPDAREKGGRCGVLVARVTEGGASVDAGAAIGDAGGVAPGVHLLAQIDSGHQLSDVVLFGNPKLVRMWGIDAKGAFVREIGYAYGRVDVAEPKRH